MVQGQGNKKGRKDRKKEKQVEITYMAGSEVDERLLEAGSEEELSNIVEVLKLEGVPRGTLTARITTLRRKGKLIFVTALTERGEGSKPLAIEGIIKEMKLPTIVNGGAQIFDAGVGYGMRVLVAGVRLAQELSQMGIAQASPVIRMATEMRKAEGMSAQEAGQVAAENALAGAIQYMSTQKADIATVPNPMMGIMARAMEPALTQVFARMTGMFSKQPAQQGEQDQGEQSQPGATLPPGWTTAEKKQSEEETK